MDSDVLSVEQKTMIDSIDKALDIVLKNMEYEDYLEFLKSNEYLNTYDHVLGYTEVNFLPDAFLTGLTMDFLTKVLDIVNNKIEEIFNN